jgi:hypothetical protein
MGVQLKFRPLSFSWVALHPQPKGVIHFIGGAFFGSLPTFCYWFLLRSLYAQGYTIIALPFRFSFRHWAIAGRLFKEQEQLRPLLIAEAQHLGYETEIYRDHQHDIWLGHSLGCKYIALLEFLSDPQWQTILRQSLGNTAAESVIATLSSIMQQPISIQDQASILMAPDISDTESAIPLRGIARLLDNLGWGVLPTRHQTQTLVQRSQLFNLTALIAFKEDDIAGNGSPTQAGRHPGEASDVHWFLRLLQQRKPPLLFAELPGKHLEPLGCQIGGWTVNPLGIQKGALASRPIEPTIVKFAEILCLPRLESQPSQIGQTGIDKQLSDQSKVQSWTVLGQGIAEGSPP